MERLGSSVLSHVCLQAQTWTFTPREETRYLLHTWVSVWRENAAPTSPKSPRYLLRVIGEGALGAIRVGDGGDGACPCGYPQQSLSPPATCWGSGGQGICPSLTCCPLERALPAFSGHSRCPSQAMIFHPTVSLSLLGLTASQCNCLLFLLHFMQSSGPGWQGPISSCGASLPLHHAAALLPGSLHVPGDPGLTLVRPYLERCVKFGVQCFQKDVKLERGRGSDRDGQGLGRQVLRGEAEGAGHVQLVGRGFRKDMRAACRYLEGREEGEQLFCLATESMTWIHG